MDVTAQFDLTNEERSELAKILECKSNELAKTLAPYAAAATKEIVSMILGQKVFTRGSDLLEYRLLLEQILSSTDAFIRLWPAGRPLVALM